MNFFFDLDGTLIDSKLRLYKLFIDLTNIDISYEKYWEFKMSMKSNEDILNGLSYSENSIVSFLESWMVKIEHDDYLVHDVDFEFTKSVLSSLYNEGHKLYVITARQSKSNVSKQLYNLELQSYFENVLVTEQLFSKRELVDNLKIALSPNDYFVGDTGLDIQTGKLLGINTVGVLSGFRTRQILETYQPDAIYDSIEDFYNDFKNRTK